MQEVTILTGAPVVAPIFEMTRINEGLVEMLRWVGERRPECLPDELREIHPGYVTSDVAALWPHRRGVSDGRLLSDNELLVELAARGCYYSFGEKAGRRSNAEFIANTQQGTIRHASVLYHAKMTFFIAGVSRRVSHELIRNYVGADRNEEGSPSQESTRYVEHGGMFVVPPLVGEDDYELTQYRIAMQTAYGQYLTFIDRMTEDWRKVHDGGQPQGLDRKRIYEAASMYLPHSTVTSFIWTTNPAALEKLFRERCDPQADLEFQRLAFRWREVCLERWPNLFPNLVRDIASGAIK